SEVECSEQLSGERPLQLKDRIDRAVVARRPLRIALSDGADGLLVPLVRRRFHEPADLLHEALRRISVADQPIACKRDADDRKLELDPPRHLRDQVPSSQEARYFACSSESVSISMPMVC